MNKPKRSSVVQLVKTTQSSNKTKPIFKKEKYPAKRKIESQNENIKYIFQRAYSISGEYFDAEQTESIALNMVLLFADMRSAITIPSHYPHNILIPSDIPTRLASLSKKFGCKSNRSYNKPTCRTLSIHGKDYAFENYDLCDVRFILYNKTLLNDGSIKQLFHSPSATYNYLGYHGLLTTEDHIINRMKKSLDNKFVLPKIKKIVWYAVSKQYLTEFVLYSHLCDINMTDKKETDRRKDSYQKIVSPMGYKVKYKYASR